MTRFGIVIICGLSVATVAVGLVPRRAFAAPAAPAAPGGPNVPAAPAVAPSAEATKSQYLVSPLVAPLAIPPKAVLTDPARKTPPITEADPAVIDAKAAVRQSSDQLDKFHQIYENATKIFGGEHTVISPSFFVAGDINGRLSATDKRQAGLSATLLVPFFGAGGGHGLDWWPVVASSDEAHIYQTFIDQLEQYQQAENNLRSFGGNIDVILHTKWNVQNLLLAKQLFCEEQLDPELPPEASEAIKKLCAGNLSTTIKPTTTGNVTSLDPSKEQQLVIDAVSSSVTSGAVKLDRHNFLIGPSLGVPLTKNPTDIFQLGLSAEMGGNAFRFMATGGLVGRYQGATYQDIFAAGWFVGLSLSGQLGDELFHYFNGGSNLLNQLAQIKTNPSSPQ